LTRGTTLISKGYAFPSSDTGLHRYPSLLTAASGLAYGLLRQTAPGAIPYALSIDHLTSGRPAADSLHLRVPHVLFPFFAFS